MNKVSENPLKNREEHFFPLMIITALFVTLYLVSNVMAVKIIEFKRIIYFDAGTITFPFAYMLGDVLTEIWGYKTARKVIWLTLLCNIVMILCTTIGVYLPSPDYMADNATAYNHVFTYVPRIVIGSLVGFLCGELTNAWLMDRIKRKTNGRWLWLRTIGSSVFGYLFDTIPFVAISFAGVAPFRDLAMMVILQYFAKLLIEATMGTPMAYALIHWLKKKSFIED